MQYSTIPIRTVAYGTTNLMGGGKIQVLLQKYLHRFTNLIKKKFNTVHDLPIFISFLCTRLQKLLFLLQRLGRVGAHEAEGLDGHSQYGCEQDCC